MSTADDVKVTLLTKRRELNSQAEQFGEAISTFSSDTAKPSPVLDAITHHWETNTLIYHALERIASGRYGVCEECGGSISTTRLSALPWAKFCITCQEKIDLAAMHLDAAA